MKSITLGAGLLALATVFACSNDDKGTGQVQDTNVVEVDTGEVVSTCPSGCDDGIACTTDLCVAGECVHAAVDEACSSGEVCRPGFGCFAPAVPDRCGTEEDPVCDDGQACTTDRCDLKTGKCIYTPDDSACSDDNFCDGEERCAPFVGCVDGLPPSCDDELECTFDSCDPEANACVNKPDDRLCTDDIQCDGIEICVVGQGCRENPDPPGCDDGFACTTDKCDLEAGGCVFTANDSACGVGEICRLDQGCTPVPTCTTVNDPACDDGQACTTDSCDVETGTCRYAPNDAACQDGTFCNGAEICAPFRGCVPGPSVDCSDGVACTLDSCDEKADRCVSAPDDRLCADGNFCDGDEVCHPTLGCQDTEPRVCDDGISCTADRCEPTLPGGGDCIFVPVHERCSDGVYCDGEERCDSTEGCIEQGRPDCDDGVPCTRDLCQGSACVHVPDDTQCGAGEICRADEGCFANRCQTEDDPVCNDGQACTADRCDLASGKCVYEPNDAVCDDGLFCTGVEACAPFAGCIIESVVACDDGVACTVDTCDEGQDACSHTAEARLCDDGVFCDGVEVCDATLGCREGAKPVCNDGIDCTIDRCDGQLDACTSRSDDDACGLGEICRRDTGCVDVPTCLGPNDPVCDDGVACTTDSCDVATGTCVYAPNDDACDNGSFCDGAEQCAPFIGCVPGPAPSCNDGIGCTLDSCDAEANACAHEADNRLCYDGDFCDGDEVCSATQGCIEGPARSCDDGVGCTEDRCEPSLPGGGACLFVPVDAKCGDGNVCDGEERCDIRIGCIEGRALDCDDQIACTRDSCGANGCEHVTDDDVCGPGEICRADVGCFSNRCQRVDDPVCDDGEACTTDRCDVASGKCVYTPNDALCDDKLFCNGVEQCTPFLGCVSGAAPSCADSVDCTRDACDPTLNRCVNVPDDRVCQDGVACNGAERCVAGSGCADATVAPGCDDGIACTTDLCDLETGGCDHIANDAACKVGEICRVDRGCVDVPTCLGANDPVCNDGQACTTDSCDTNTGKCVFTPVDSRCSNGQYCDGVERCTPFLGCVAGTAPNCNDGVSCTLDSCDENNDRCRNTADNRLCADGNFCDGDEVCDPQAGCKEGPARVCDDKVACTQDRCEPTLAGGGGCQYIPRDERCDDGVFCDGTEWCDEIFGCQDEAAPDCDDGIACTRDSCSGSSCQHLADDSLCGAGEICRGDVGCFANRCQTETDPICDDGQPCTTDRCNLATGKCVYTNNDALCDDGLFCNGQEVCSPFRGCLIASVAGCDDGIDCTIDRCNEDTNSCTYFAEPRLCDNGVFCDGAETCDPNSGCKSGTPPTCNDQIACTIDACNTLQNRCTNTPRDADNDGIADKTCGGFDCDDGNADVNPLEDEICNGIDDNCDGDIDEGVSSECGTCDATCKTAGVGQTTGANVQDFTPGGLVGTFFDAAQGGIVIQQVTTTSNYLWVPNSAESTLSKWDATTATEIGRYRVGYEANACVGLCCWDNYCNAPSRVAVDGRGDAYVANRGFAMQGSVTKIAGDLSRCVDRNKNGKIDTSTNATPMAWNTDECILWNVAVGESGSTLRAVAIDRGDASFPQGYPWIGGYSNSKFWKLNPDTGATLVTVQGNARPYGAVVTANGTLWVGTIDEDAISSINTTTNAVGSRKSYPDSLRGTCGESYGITADGKGRIWISGWGCADSLGYDPATDKWTRINTSSWGLYTGRGITVDRMGRVWMAVGGDGQAYVTVWDSDVFKADTNIVHTAPLIRLPNGHNGPSGVGADAEGNIWIAHHATSQLVKLRPDTLQLTSYTGPNRVYTYSDFTGSVRRTTIGQGAYTHTVNAGCLNPTWKSLVWDATVPTGATVELSVRTAASSLDLSSATATTFTASPADIKARFTSLNIVHRAVLGITATLKANASNVSPVLKSFRVEWQCP